MGKQFGRASRYAAAIIAVAALGCGDAVAVNFAATKLTVIWKNAKGENVYTDFAEFSGDRRRMVQLPFEGGPRREFRRC